MKANVNEFSGFEVLPIGREFTSIITPKILT